MAISGPPESIKTVVAWILAREHVRAGNTIAVVDFEMGPYATRRLLLDLGFTLEEIRDQVLYYDSPGEPSPPTSPRSSRRTSRFVVIDAAAGAYDASGLDDNKRQDVERFARAWVRPLFEVGITTVLIDHVTKNSETRGKYMIGSERKLGGVDVHLGLELVGQAAHAWRLGHRQGARPQGPRRIPDRPVATELHLQSDPETHRLTWEWKAPASAVAAGGDWRPTIYMERVSRHLEEHGPMSRTAIYKAGLGKRELLVQAVECLLEAGNLTEDGSLLVPAVPFRRDEAGSLVPKPFPAVPGTGSHRFPPFPRLQGGNRERGTTGQGTRPPASRSRPAREEARRGLPSVRGFVRTRHRQQRRPMPRMREGGRMTVRPFHRLRRYRLDGFRMPDGEWRQLKDPDGPPTGPNS